MRKFGISRHNIHRPKDKSQDITPPFNEFPATRAPAFEQTNEMPSRAPSLSLSFLSLPSSFLFRHLLSFLRSRRVDLVDSVEKARGALAEVLRSVLT